MPLKDFFKDNGTVADWRKREKEKGELWMRRFCDNLLPWLLLAALIAFITVLPGCSAWYEPSPELDYWKCIEVTGSYVQCEHLEMVR